jgi:histidinol-phosphate aminotransferase
MVQARKLIEEMEPYAAPAIVEAEVKLNQNESPYNLPPRLVEEIKTRLSSIQFNRYNEGTSKRVRELLGKKFSVSADQIIVGAGVDELLYYLIMAFVEKGDKLVRPVPSFAMYEICARVSGARDCAIFLGQDFELTEEFVRESIDAKLVFICRPNNPTSNSFDKMIIERIIKQTKGIVCIDEAYAEFAKENCLDFLKYENVLIFRTFSKAYSCAGVRLGYAISNEKIIDRMNRVRLPWNIGILSQIVGEIVLMNDDLFMSRVEEIKAERDQLFGEMKKFVRVLPSDSNFITFEVNDPKSVFGKLQEKGILIRNISKYPMLSKYLRVNVGTKEENRKFLEALKEICGKPGAVATATDSSDGIIFDIDGVLVDVSKSYREAIKQTASALSGRTITDADVEEIKKLPNSNNDWDVTYALITGVRNMASIDRNDPTYKKAKAKFQDLYLDGLRDKETPIAKSETLRTLSERGYKLGVVTSRPRDEAFYVLDRLFPGIFKPGYVVAQEDCDVEKPSPKPLLKAKQLMDCGVVVYVGDTINDALAARAADMKFVSVVPALEADYKIKDVNKIFEVLT